MKKEQDDTNIQQDGDAVVEKDDVQESGCKCEEYKAGWARAQADYQNLQKEMDQKRSEWVQMSEIQVLEEFIPVYDNFKKAFAVEIDGDDKLKSWKQGIEYIMKQFGDILKQHDVEEIKTVGEQFDPNLHEAMGEEEGKEEGVILKEIESGYLANGKVLKVAKVIVTK